MTELTLYVDGMGCRDCVREVTARLRDVAGVETVAADHRRSVVLLGGSMTRGGVLAALEGTRFQVDRIGELTATRQGADSSRRDALVRSRHSGRRHITDTTERHHHEFHDIRGNPERPTLAGAGADRRGPVHGHHGHLHHRRRVARDAGRPRLHAPGAELGVQRLRRRVRRPAPARGPALRPLRRTSHLQHRLGRARRRLAPGRPRRQRRGRAGRSGYPGRRLGAHRPSGADLAVHDLRSKPEGADEGARALRRRRSGRRDRGRVPGWRAHRVRLVALGLLHQRAAGARGPGPDSVGHAPGRPAARLPGPGRRRHGHGWPRRPGVRDRPRPGSRVDLALHVDRRCSAASHCWGSSSTCRPTVRSR